MSFNSALQFVFANNIVERKPSNKQLSTLAVKVAIGKLNPKLNFVNAQRAMLPAPPPIKTNNAFFILIF